MPNCNDCKKDVPANDLVIDHILPRLSTRYDHDDNLQSMHRNCNRINNRWYKRLWRWIEKQLNRFYNKLKV